MRAVFISDIHSNLEALNAVAATIPDAPIYCLGDVVGYGANPNEVIEWVRENVELCILGNHDVAVLSGDVSWFNPAAAKAIKWSRGVIKPQNLNFLKSLADRARLNIVGLKTLLVHGSPDDPISEYVYLETHSQLFNIYLHREGVDLIGMGHTHIPYAWRSSSGVVFNPGSVGQPRSGNPQACYAILEYDGATLNIEHKLIRYDIESAASKILASGLPTFLASRLFSGI
ncbi:MAG: metallophosphoesterase family protein [Nitrososphaerales archaeon]